MSVYIISELCGQWGGSVRRAEQMILQSKLGGADAVKVQLYDTYRMPGDNRERWEYLSMTRDQFLRLYEFANKLNIDFFASAFHKDRFEWIRETDIKINKIASSLVRDNYEFCQEMIASEMLTYCSLGAWDVDSFPYPFDDPNVKYMHCVSKYPHSFEEALQEMPQTFDGSLLVGYSDHTTGINACKVACARGATVLEKHFTTSRALQRKTESAHVCSMLMSELEHLRTFTENMQEL
jgi:N,N'-diacetyllegionaminate synthase